MFVQPLHTILAIQTGGSAFKVFTRAELSACQVLGGTYFCPNSNILDKRIKTNCVLRLFNRDQEVITAHCPWISIAATDFNIQLGANTFLLYLANSKEVHLVCGKESASRSFHGLKQLTVPAGCQLFTESYIMEGLRNFSLSVDTFLERHVNVKELFNFSRLRVEDMAGILQDLDLVGSTTGLTIQNIKDRYGDYSVERTFVWVTRWVVVALTILGLVGIFWCLRKRFMKAKKDHRPLLKRFRDLFSSDTQPRDHEMQERGNPDTDENEDFIANMTPDDMRVGPPVHAPVNVGDVARRARDERARDELRAEARVRDHRADVYRDQQSASAGATGGAVSRH
jgi:hypothetical protein